MKDSTVANRGHYKDCGVDKCSVYKIQKNKDGCYPVKHAKIPDEDNASKETNKDLGDATYNDVNDELVRNGFPYHKCKVTTH